MRPGERELDVPFYVASVRDIPFGRIRIEGKSPYPARRAELIYRHASACEVIGDTPKVWNIHATIEKR